MAALTEAKCHIFTLILILYSLTPVYDYNLSVEVDHLWHARSALLYSSLELYYLQLATWQCNEELEQQNVSFVGTTQSPYTQL